jgi:hypothetical protein
MQCLPLLAVFDTGTPDTINTAFLVGASGSSFYTLWRSSTLNRGYLTFNGSLSAFVEKTRHQRFLQTHSEVTLRHNMSLYVQMCATCICACINAAILCLCSYKSFCVCIMHTATRNFITGYASNRAS